MIGREGKHLSPIYYMERVKERFTSFIERSVYTIKVNNAFFHSILFIKT